MILPDTLLYIYEIRGDLGIGIHPPPPSFVGLWNEDDFLYLFFTSPEDEYVANVVCKGPTRLSARHEILYKDWQSNLPQEGVQIGSIHFARADDPAPARGSLLLDPSVVFGDGSHPTTVACISEIERIVGSRNVQSMLDLGTGSGILSLAAASLGVGRVVAVDRNLLAIQTVRSNVKLNNLTGVIQVRAGEARLFIDTPYDLVAANLPFQVLRDLVVLRNATLHQVWIVSGINAQQADVLRELLFDQGYALDHFIETPPWVTFSAVRKKE